MGKPDLLKMSGAQPVLSHKDLGAPLFESFHNPTNCYRLEHCLVPGVLWGNESNFRLTLHCRRLPPQAVGESGGVTETDEDLEAAMEDFLRKQAEKESGGLSLYLPFVCWMSLQRETINEGGILQAIFWRSLPRQSWRLWALT